MRGRVPGSVGFSRMLVMTAGGLTSSISSLVSFFSPVIQEVSVESSDDWMGLSLSLSGSGFGLSSFSATVRGHSASTMTLWVSDTAMQCRLSSEPLGSTRVSVTVGDFTGTLSDGFSYTAVFVDSTAQSNLARDGSSSLLFTTHFEARSFSSRLRLRGSNCHTTTWVSNTGLACRPASAGAFSGSVVSVTAGRIVGSVSSGVSFDAPVPKSIVHNGTRREDGIQVQFELDIVGSAFSRLDASIAMRSGDTSCHATVWTSDSTMTCSSPAFMGGGGHPVAVSVSTLIGTLSNAFTTDVSIPSSVQGSNIAARPMQSVTLFGSAFGNGVHTTSIRLGGSVVEASNWISDTALKLKTASGLSVRIDLAVSINRAISTISEFLSYDVLSVSQSLTHGGNVPGTGSVSVTVSGHNFGISSFTVKQHIGMSRCEGGEWISDTTVRALTSSGTHNGLGTALTVAEILATVSQVFSYDSHEPSAISSANGPAHEQQAVAVTVLGNGFGQTHNSGSLRLGATACDASSWHSDTSVQCLHSYGSSVLRAVVMTSEFIVSSMSEAFTFDAGTVAPYGGCANVPTHGTLVSNSAGCVLMAGVGLSASYSGTARFGQTTCTSTSWMSETAVHCIPGKGELSGLAGTVTVERQISCFTRLFTYDAANLNSLMHPNAPSAVATEVSMSGLNFATVSTSGSARLGGSACVATEWESDTVIKCLTPMSLAETGLSTTVTVAAFSHATLSSAFSFDAALVSGSASTFPANMGNSSTFFLNGNGFGTSDYTLQALLGTYGCTNTEWTSDTTLQCNLNEGNVERDIPISVIQSARLCKICSGSQALIGCTSASAGKCVQCDSCTAGEYRDCDVGGSAR